jgi:sodium-dependent dicarboxylate transporter 2/3/5
MKNGNGKKILRDPRQTIGLFLGPIIFIILLVFPIHGISSAAARLAAILGFTIVYWICEPIPLPVTALLAPVLCVILGIGEPKTILASFGDPVVFLFLGSFLLAQAMIVHQLDRRIALSILGLEWVGKNTRRVLFVFGAMTAFISMWLSNTATTAMLLPIGLGILGEIATLAQNQTRTPTVLSQLNMSSGLMLMTAYAASIGGIGTPIGTPPNLIGIGMIDKLIGIHITFFDWMKFAVPTLILMYFVLYWLILKLNPPEFGALPQLSSYLRKRKEDLGPWTRGQINVLIAFLIAVALWVLPGVLGLIYGGDAPITKGYQKILPEGIIAVIAASLLFFLPVEWKTRRVTLSWEEAVKIDWGTILLFGGGIALGSLIFSTGLADALGNLLLNLTGIRSYWGIAVMSIAMGILLSETTSNTASANVVIPLAISMARSAGVDPLIPALGACLGASYGFMLPVSTPPNAIVYGSGLVPITKMVKTGIIFDIIGLFLIWAGLWVATWIF